MEAAEALKITVDTLKLDATLLGEAPNLNRVTFWLSEIRFGIKWTGSTWSHTVPRDIIKTAAAIAESNHTARELLALAEGK
jgi:hypothetical protein